MVKYREKTSAFVLRISLRTAEVLVPFYRWVWQPQFTRMLTEF